MSTLPTSARVPSRLAMFSGAPSIWVTAVVATVAVGLATGVPTDLVPTDLYVRMTPAPWWSYPIWAATAVLAGLTMATYVGRRRVRSTAPRSLVGGTLSFLAVGCPVCNKLVVALLGTASSLSYFAPMQPVLGMAGVGALATARALRLGALDRCGVGPSARAARPTNV
jgi:hypothetical protein